MCNQTANHPKWARHSHQHPFNRHMHSKMRSHMSSRMGMTPVNVEEMDDKYELHVFAAGYSKSDFDVKIKNDTLIISAKSKELTESETGNSRRREFLAEGFERQFILNEEVDKAAIDAKYNDGILKVTLPKLAGFETTRAEIEIN